MTIIRLMVKIDEELLKIERPTSVNRHKVRKITFMNTTFEQ